MGWFTSSSPSPPAPKLSADGAPIAPDRSERARCWEARDGYFACLDRNGIVDSIMEKDKAAKACSAEGKVFEANCASSWSAAGSEAVMSASAGKIKSWHEHGIPVVGMRVFAIRIRQGISESRIDETFQRWHICYCKHDNLTGQDFVIEIYVTANDREIFDPAVASDITTPGEVIHQNTLLEEPPYGFVIFLNSSTHHLTNSPSRIFINPGTNDDPTTGASLKRWLGLEEVVSTGLDVLLSRQKQTRSSETLTNFQLSDPHMNNVRVSRPSLFAAFLHNARCFGIQIPDLFKLSYNSPFYTQMTVSNDPNVLLAAASNATIPPHLQPTLLQILFPHHAFLDLVSFPLMRVHAISLVATSQTFEPIDPKRDIMNGLVCCHGSSVVAQGSGQPWDMHSWEIAP
ncbi:hypothetical protein B7494_g7462 [Chlorociboria aeruginascens]|nr:hypothetical protein B7494_g7462 [Chlorociboria aeruginascens]